MKGKPKDKQFSNCQVFEAYMPELRSGQGSESQIHRRMGIANVWLRNICYARMITPSGIKLSLVSGNKLSSWYKPPI